MGGAWVGNTPQCSKFDATVLVRHGIGIWCGWPMQWLLKAINGEVPDAAQPGVVRTVVGLLQSPAGADVGFTMGGGGSGG